MLQSQPVPLQTDSWEPWLRLGQALQVNPYQPMKQALLIPKCQNVAWVCITPGLLGVSTELFPRPSKRSFLIVSYVSNWIFTLWWLDSLWIQIGPVTLVKIMNQELQSPVIVAWLHPTVDSFHRWEHFSPQSMTFSLPHFCSLWKHCSGSTPIFWLFCLVF